MAERKPPRMSSVEKLCDYALKGMDWHRWYQSARTDIIEVCKIRGWSVDRFIDVLALTSPRTQVKKNIRVTMRYMSGESLDFRVMKTITVALKHWEETGEIRGPKTSAFAACLHGDLSRVVLDVWMAHAFNVDQRLFATKYTSYPATQRVIDAADIVGLRPAEAQAAIWAASVREHRVTVPSMRITDELTLFDFIDKEEIYEEEIPI